MVLDVNEVHEIVVAEIMDSDCLQFVNPKKSLKRVTKNGNPRRSEEYLQEMKCYKILKSYLHANDMNGIEFPEVTERGCLQF